MKINSQNDILLDTNNATSKNSTINTNKTTNINILLNRVRLDEKNDFKKKLIFLSILFLTISFVSFFALI